MQPSADRAGTDSGIPRTPELLGVARRLIWWMPPEEALECPGRFLAQVMTLGTWDDLQQVRTALGERCLRAVFDLTATKLKVLPERAESRDYLDLPHLLSSGVNLARGLGAARALYGERFNPMISLRALSYFADGDLPRLPEETKRFLAHAAAAVRDIPAIARLSDILADQP